LIDFIIEKGVHQSAEREYFKNDELMETWKAVMKLPVKLREVIVLYAHHQLSIAEIAALMGLSESTVKVRLHRARNKVNKRLKEGDWSG
jgi:RNA polymerase sigma-70 factor (ECF subfamily)